MRQILATTINRLGEREQMVLTLYYYEGLTLSEIGESWASRRVGSARSTPRRCCSCAPACVAPPTTEQPLAWVGRSSGAGTAQRTL